MNTYQEKLLDPRWQRKRLEVLSRANWKCDCCEAENKTLHVHHLVYEAEEPWETDGKYLEALCEGCHEWREEFNSFWGRSKIPTFFAAKFDAVFRPFWSGESTSFSMSMRKGMFRFMDDRYKGVIARRRKHATDGSDWVI